MKKTLYLIVTLVLLFTHTVSLEAHTISPEAYVDKLHLNGLSLPLPKPLPIVKGKVLIPFEWMVSQMGASETLWDADNRVLMVNIPTFLKQRQYLSYWYGLESNIEGITYPLPQRLKRLKLPPYPLTHGSSSLLDANKQPITLNVMDQGFTLPYAVYDYEIIDSEVYIGADWLNTLFLANLSISPKAQTLKITYLTPKDLDRRIEKLEKKLFPLSPEEALILWIRGQQLRSGVFQYTALSPKLKEQVLQYTARQGWVTGGSSPSLGKVIALSHNKLPSGEVFYTITYEETSQGQVQATPKQEIVIKNYNLKGKSYWFIEKATGNMDYSVLN